MKYTRNLPPVKPSMFEEIGYWKRQTERAEVCLSELEAERDHLKDCLYRANWGPCDIPACNCGGWHERGPGRREQRVSDILDAMLTECKKARDLIDPGNPRDSVEARELLIAAIAKAEGGPA